MGQKVSKKGLFLDPQGHNFEVTNLTLPQSYAKSHGKSNSASLGSLRPLV